MDYLFESLGPGPLGKELLVCVSPIHKFGTDAFLLADFTKARHKELCADLGAGCGIVSLALYKKYFPKKIYAVELQPEAAAQCRETVRVSGAEERIIPIEGDLRTLAEFPAASLDLVVCNPPFQPQNTGLLSPVPGRRAARHELTCTLEDVCAAGRRLLKFGGRLCICQRPERLADVICAMRAYGIEPKRLRFAAKNPAAQPWLFLLEGKLGAKPFMQTEPLLSAMNADGSFTEEMLKIYGNLPEGEEPSDL